MLGKAKLEEAESINEAVGFLAINELRALLTDPQGYALLLDKQVSAKPKGHLGGLTPLIGRRADDETVQRLRSS